MGRLIPHRLATVVGRLFCTAFLLCACNVTLAQPSQDQDTQAKPPCVILLHGLWRSALAMKRLEWELEDAGWEVVNLSYPSSSYPIVVLADMAVSAGLAECRTRGLDQVHFVTHSLGGILVRVYLEQNRLEQLGRVVMLAPPNQGSVLADYATSLDMLQPLLPPAVEELGTSERSVPLSLGRVDFSLGIIAGTSNTRAYLPGLPDVPADGTVTVAETIVPGMTDFIELPVTHTYMMWDDEVIAQVLYFLNNGYFRRLAPPFISP